VQWIPLVRPLAAGLAVLVVSAAASVSAQTEEYAGHYLLYEQAVEAGDLESAVVHARRAYLAAARERGPDDRYTGVLAYNLGVVNLELGRFRDAAVSLARALEIYEKAYGKSDEHLVAPLTKLAAAHQNLEEWVASERAYVRAVRIIEGARGRDEPEIVLLLGQLAQVADGLGEPKRMRSYGLRALSITSDDPEADPTLVAKLHISVARAEMLLGDIRQAKRHTEVAVDLFEKTLGEDDPRTIEVYAFAAEIYDIYGKEYAARKYRRKVEEAGGDPGRD
jgi:tetratricopeptide (TPR) repeat protein